METILNWSWPHVTTFRFYIVQLFFWSGYAILAGLLGTWPYYYTRYRQTAWTTFVLGAMGTLMAYLSQFLFQLDKPLDMISPYAIGVSVVVAALLTPILSLFAFVCQPEDDVDAYDSTYDDEYQDDNYRQDARYKSGEYEEYEGGRVYRQPNRPSESRVARRPRRRR